jgi:3-phytase
LLAILIKGNIMIVRNLCLLVLTVFLSACASFHSQTNKLTSLSIKKMTLLSLESPPSIGSTHSGQHILLGGFSGLTTSSENNILYSLTDRGPNGYNIENDRPFLIPEFTPTILKLKINPEDKSFKVMELIQIKNANGKPITGLPNNKNDENPIDVYNKNLNLDKDGLDTEGIVQDNSGGFWVADEYGPSLVHIDQFGKIIDKLSPENILPAGYKKRKINRGFEGISIFDNKMYGILQSPLPGDDGFSRMVAIDLEKRKVEHEYFYKFEKGIDKIGDLFSIRRNQFLVVEHNSQKGKSGFKKIFFASIQNNSQFLEKKLLIDLNDTPFVDVEKVEGLTILDHNKIALVNDNDFQIDDKTNFNTGITKLNSCPTQILIIEFYESL